MTDTPSIETPDALSDEALKEALASLQAEAQRREDRVKARTALAEALSAIRPAIEAYAKATGKSPAAIFKECPAIFKELPPIPAGVVEPEASEPQAWESKPAGYGAGIQVVYEGEVWKSKIEGNLYSPGIAPTTWERKGPASA